MDNKYDEFEFVEQYLTGGEYVLWKGKPEKGNLFTRGDIIPFILSLLWCAVAVYFFADEITSGDTFDFLFMVPFIGIGFYASVGRFMHLASRRKRTWYAITNKKIIRKIGHHVDMLDGEKLPPFRIEMGRGGNGNVWFGERDVYRRKSLDENDLYVFLMENVKDPVRVCEIINGMDSRAENPENSYGGYYG